MFKRLWDRVPAQDIGFVFKIVCSKRQKRDEKDAGDGHFLRFELERYSLRRGSLTTTRPPPFLFST